MARFRRRLGVTAALLLVLAAGLLLLDRLSPPDLSRLRATARLVTDRRGEPLRVLATGEGVLRLPASVADVDPRYLDILMAYEDRRFRHHFGVDPLSLLRAVAQAVRYGRVVSGGSTLTMQTARLLMPHERNLPGKLVEMLRALQLEWRYGKDEILAMYLTLAPMGGNLEGARMASLAYFGKEPRKLSTAEAALLVALPQSPERRRPDRAPEEARRGRQRVLDRLVGQGVLAPRLAAEAIAAEAPLGRRPLPFLAPHLAERLAAEAPLPTVIASSLDRNLQIAVEALAARHAAALGPEVGTAVLVVENRTRQVRAYVGSPDYFSLARRGAVDMVRVARSPGSTLKPFIYGLAFDRRLIHPLTRILDAPRSFRDYAPRNFDGRFRGEMTVAEALRQSLNVPAVAVLDRVGPLAFAAALEQAGVALAFDDPEARPNLALALGGTGLTLEQLVTLYAALAEGGQVLPLSLREGETAQEEVRPLMGKEAAEFLTLILKEATPPAGFLREGDGIAYKTGTSYGYRDAWSIGYDALYTVGVWVGRADGTPVPNSAGRRSAAPLLFAIFRLLNEGHPPRQRLSPATRLAAAEVPSALAFFDAPLLSLLPEAVSRPGRLGLPLAIAFPPPDSEVALKRRGAGFAPLPLTVEGGRPPYRWLVEGRLLGESGPRPFAWAPEGPGFYDVSVIDTEGATATRRVRLR